MTFFLRHKAGGYEIIEQSIKQKNNERKKKQHTKLRVKTPFEKEFVEFVKDNMGDGSSFTSVVFLILKP